MKRTLTLLAIFTLCAPALTTLGGCASTKGETPQEKRDYALKMRSDALAELYKQVPDAKAKIDKAAGYGAFSNIGTNIIFVSTGGGYGVVRDNDSGKDTYMKMGEVGVGLGLGITDFRAVFIFNDKLTLKKFVDDGWDFGASAEAVAQGGDQGGGASGAGNVSTGMEIYQFTENGISLSATVSGTKYWKDGSLN